MLTYYEGTQPRQYCDLHEFKSEQTETGIRQLSAQQNIIGGGRIDSNLDFDPADLDTLLKNLGPSIQTPPPPSGAKASQILD